MAIFWNNPRDRFADSCRLAEDFEVGDSPGMKTTLSPCLLSQVVWTVRVLPTRLDLAVFRDRSHGGQQSWMKHSRTVPICFDQKTGELFSPNSLLSENDSSCINCMSCGIYPRSRMPIIRGDAAKIFSQLFGYGKL